MTQRCWNGSRGKFSGKPIAGFINYPVHVTVMGLENYQISGDLAGATSRYEENYYRRKPKDTPLSDAGPRFGCRLKPRPTASSLCGPAAQQETRSRIGSAGL